MQNRGGYRLPGFFSAACGNEYRGQSDGALSCIPQGSVCCVMVIYRRVTQNSSLLKVSKKGLRKSG